MPSLELLRLANNNFTQFPTAVLQLPKLAWLSLAGNPCTKAPVSHPSQLDSRFRIRNLRDDFDVDWSHPFGGGTSGVAFPAVQRKTRRKVAVKKFKASTGSDGRAMDEIAVSLAASGIEGVIHAVGFWVEQGVNGDVVDLGLVTELVGEDAKCVAVAPSFESCTRSVYEKGQSLSREMAGNIVSVVKRGVEGLLKAGLAHGDVYGHNVMVGRKRDGEGTVVLGDLGAAWFVPEEVREGVWEIEMRAFEVFRREIMSMVDEDMNSQRVRGDTERQPLKVY